MNRKTHRINKGRKKERGDGDDDVRSLLESNGGRFGTPEQV